MQNQSQPPLFTEVQYMRRVFWVMVLIYGTAALMWVGFIQQIVFQQPFGTNPGPDWIMWLLWLGVGIGLPWLFNRMRLKVEVYDDHLQIHYVPFLKRVIWLTDIKDFQARTYNPIREYGGWGIKGWSKSRAAYNVSGNKGVELEFTNGQRLMLGSQQATALAQAITTAQKQQSRNSPLTFT